MDIRTWLTGLRYFRSLWQSALDHRDVMIMIFDDVCSFISVTQVNLRLLPNVPKDTKLVVLYWHDSKRKMSTKTVLNVRLLSLPYKFHHVFILNRLFICVQLAQYLTTVFSCHKSDRWLVEVKQSVDHRGQGHTVSLQQFVCSEESRRSSLRRSSFYYLLAGRQRQPSWFANSQSVSLTSGKRGIHVDGVRPSGWTVTEEKPHICCRITGKFGGVCKYPYQSSCSVQQAV